MEGSHVSTELQVFKAFVTYAQPSYEDLQGQFDEVQQILRYRRLDRARYCRDISQNDRELIFEYFWLGHDATVKDLITKMNRYDIRPATFEEVVCFDKQYPEEKGKYSIVGLGSVTRLNRRDHYPELKVSGGKRCLDVSIQDHMVINPSTGMVTHLIKSRQVQLLAVRW